MERENCCALVLETPLDDEETLFELYAWLEHWRSEVYVCSRYRGSWYEGLEILAPPDALEELPEAVGKKITVPH
jgi:hypothetical protein